MPIPRKNNSKKMDLTKEIEEVVRPQKNESRQELVIPHQSSSFGKIAFTFIGLAIILILAVFYFSYFYTTLIITPNLQPVSADFEVQVTLLDKIKEEGGELGDIYKILEEWSTNNPDKISGEVLEEIVEKEETFAVTSEGGEKKTGTAHGMITVFNKQNVAQDLIAKTRFQTENGVIFRIREPIKIPANGQLETEVFAAEEGEAGNIGPSKFILPGFSSEAKRKAVYAESYKPMAGGVVYEKVLTQADINTANQKMQEKLYNEGLVRLDAKLKEIMSGAEEEKLPVGEGEEIATEKTLINSYEKILPQAVVKEVQEVIITPEIGTKTNEFKLKMKMKVTAILFNEENLLTLAKLKLEDKISENHQLVSIDESGLTYSIKKYDTDLGMAILEVSLTGEGYLISTDLIDKFTLKSLEPEAIQSYLDNHPEIANIEVKEAPIWLKKLPILKDRVKVEVKLPE